METMLTKSGAINVNPTFLDKAKGTVNSIANNINEKVYLAIAFVASMLSNATVAFADNTPEISINGDKIDLSGNGWGEGSMTETAGEILKKYQNVINYITVGAILTLVLIGIFFAVKYASSGSNAQEANKNKKGLITVIIAAAIVGGVWMLIGLFVNFLA